MEILGLGLASPIQMPSNSNGNTTPIQDMVLLFHRDILGPNSSIKMFGQIDLSRQIKGETNAGKSGAALAPMLHIPNTSYSLRDLQRSNSTPPQHRACETQFHPAASKRTCGYVSRSPHEFQSLVRGRCVSSNRLHHDSCLLDLLVVLEKWALHPRLAFIHQEPSKEMITATPKLGRAKATHASLLCGVYVRREMVGVWGLSVGSLVRKLLREGLGINGFWKGKPVEG